ncbi:MAG: FkbM family methyltransferase [Fibromonadaceae bacterium]|jgi:FkbM family methyltransferase|nr:FkbM family methyltransferase [Fibromonadaceae bacterium]
MFFAKIIPYRVLSMLISIKPEVLMRLLIFNKRLKREANNEYLTKTTFTPIDNNIVEIVKDDYKFPMYVRNGTTDVLIYKSIMESAEYDFLVKNEPKVIIDAGANIGLASVLFANKYPFAKIIAIEPEESNFEMLKKNTAPYSNIHIIKAALWNSICELDLFGGYDHWGFRLGMDRKESRMSKQHLTKTITIEKIIEDFNVDKIDILKIDIEGSEKEVFDSSFAWIDKVNSIIVELHETIKKGCNKAFCKISKKYDGICKHGEYVYLTKDDYINMNER